MQDCFVGEEGWGGSLASSRRRLKNKQRNTAVRFLRDRRCAVTRTAAASHLSYIAAHPARLGPAVN